MVAPVSGVGAAVIPVVVAVLLGERPEALVWIGIALAFPHCRWILGTNNHLLAVGCRRASPPPLYPHRRLGHGEKKKKKKKKERKKERKN